MATRDSIERELKREKAALAKVKSVPYKYRKQLKVVSLLEEKLKGMKVHAGKKNIAPAPAAKKHTAKVVTHTASKKKAAHAAPAKKVAPAKAAASSGHYTTPEKWMKVAKVKDVMKNISGSKDKNWALFRLGYSNAEVHEITGAPMPSIARDRWKGNKEGVL